jgi:hypothetical protein
MFAAHIQSPRTKIPQARPADGKSVSQRRAGKNMLADEAFNDRPSRAARYAEAALMCAVLEDAIDCFQKQFSRATRHAKHLGREAEEWLFADDLNWPFSFVSICTALELCPQYIRQGLKRWHDIGQDEQIDSRPRVLSFKNRRTTMTHTTVDH